MTTGIALGILVTGLLMLAAVECRRWLEQRKPNALRARLRPLRHLGRPAGPPAGGRHRAGLRPPVGGWLIPRARHDGS